MNIRALSGITEFAENMKTAMSLDQSENDGSPNKDRYSKIDEAYTLLQNALRAYVSGSPEEGIEGAGIQGLLDIWCMETTPMYRVKDEEGTWYTSEVSEVPAGAKFTQVNNPNHAINAVCWEGSPVMLLLGINGQDACAYMTPGRLRKIVDYCFSKTDAFGALSDIIWKQRDVPGEHERETGKPAWACEDCRKALQTQLVRKFRAVKGRQEKAFLGRVVGALNAVARTQRVVGADSGEFEYFETA
jgi:hypothetical protein